MCVPQIKAQVDTRAEKILFTIAEVAKKTCHSGQFYYHENKPI
jgi:hypothetical protein